METQTQIKSFQKFFFLANGYGPTEAQQYHFLSLNDFDRTLVINTLEIEARKNDLAIANRNFR